MGIDFKALFRKRLAALVLRVEERYKSIVLPDLSKALYKYAH